jgi:uncharacterized protein
MDLDGSKVIAADRATVWARLNDPAALMAAIPGCTHLTGSPEAGFEATVVQKVGPVKATFRGTVRLTDVVYPESYRIEGEGKGGVAGFAKGAADVRLEEVPEGTVLHYKVEAQVGGKIAQLGSRIIGGYARNMADGFFDRFVAMIEGRETA